MRASHRRAAALVLLLLCVAYVAAAAADAPPPPPASALDQRRSQTPQPPPPTSPLDGDNNAATGGPRMLRGRSAVDAFTSALDQRGSAAAAAAAGPDGSSTAAAAVPDSVRARSAFWSRQLLHDGDLYFAADVAKLVYSCSGIEGSSGSGSTALLAADGGGADPAPFFNASADAAPADASGLAFPNEQDPLGADAFRLHSRPGAPRRIVLDFTGHKLRAGTAWKGVNKNGDVPIATPPYDLDNDTSTFSATERASIVSIWRHVSEDFSAWDVDVTTEEPPGTDDQADASLLGVGTRVAIGKNNGWFDNAGGVAFISGFGQDWSGPVAFVFNSFAPSVAVAVSHEIGHTFGLAHHGDACASPGTLEASYYPGHGGWGKRRFFFLFAWLRLL